MGPVTESRTLGWRPVCKCDAENVHQYPKPTVPCIVLDPFGGAATVDWMARSLGRRAILIELNPAYCEMSKKRLDGPLYTAEYESKKQPQEVFQWEAE